MAPANSAQQAGEAASRAAQRAGDNAQRGANSISRWVEENRALAITLGVSTLAVGGAGVYYLLSGPRRPPGGGEEQGGKGEKATSGAAKKKKKSKAKKASAVDREDGPLLDEASDEDLFALSVEEIKRLPEERRKDLAQKLKVAGNKAYSQREFESAIGHYTKAIAAAPQAVFFSNRAACYSNLGRPADVIPDCNEALKLDTTYVKALNRRALAQEQLGGAASAEGEEGEAARGMLFKSLVDFTAVGILGRFSDQSAVDSVERVLKTIASSKAKEILRTREPKLPSPTFVTAYLEAFRPKPRPALPAAPSRADNQLMLAYDAIDARNYPHALSLLNESLIEDDPQHKLSTEELEAMALNMRGTFKFVIGDAAGALEDLERSTSLRPDHAQTWVKKASVHMELSDKDAAFNDFEVAIRADAKDPDIYYHRGQVHFILGEYTEAIKDYQKSTQLDDKFIFSQVQHAVALYKSNSTDASMREFNKLLKVFNGSSEAHNYYGELLLDQQKFEAAVAQFDRAIAIEQDKERSSNVLPMINKALALFQWQQDMPTAERLCRQALEKDPDCDTAIATLAQLSLQQGKITDAIGFFERSAKIARTYQELENAITYENASRAQLQFIKDYPEQGKELTQLAQLV
ncbi:putative mitochondrial precursor protein import receptor tom70 [Ceraceosorus guamensis]|uniref:Putative mitochondrial protein import receptor tom70 n=1 Tax=Ceraceosorus guamensis TaxID=1522189 RepID=A0A316W5Q5_9BASI|nr:putative mitochondrial precursor protein import receptor tom70 [Ceraceosorus guamensis]PWN45207.1 putative mitochondrial precursor protein import receptor tom70 [Ceraceosorus guamensis]